MNELKAQIARLFEQYDEGLVMNYELLYGIMDLTREKISILDRNLNSIRTGGKR